MGSALPCSLRMAGREAVSSFSSARMSASSRAANEKRQRHIGWFVKPVTTYISVFAAVDRVTQATICYIFAFIWCSPPLSLLIEMNVCVGFLRVATHRYTSINRWGQYAFRCCSLSWRFHAYLVYTRFRVFKRTEIGVFSLVRAVDANKTHTHTIHW